ncbi:MAG TPA: hypothetical protein EYG92_00170 [Lutibacter sp.]|nr:hypothetical protein [Lutibacter sp.]
MNKLKLILVVLIGFSFYSIQKQKEIQKIEKPNVENGFVINDEDYTIRFKLENTNSQNPILVIAMELKKGAHYISPFAKRDFKGKFYMDLGSYKDIDFEEEIVEIPKSIEEIDPHPFTNGTVNWVRVNTTYKQALNIKTKGDFEVFGRVRFTIEPRCTLEEIPFAIRIKDGVIKLYSPKC